MLVQKEPSRIFIGRKDIRFPQ